MLHIPYYFRNFAASLVMLPNWQKSKYMEKEIWKPIPGFEMLYEISNYGRVKRVAHTSVDRNGRELYYKEKIIKYGTNRDGYLTVNLTDYFGIPFTKTVHALVADAFIPNPEKLPCVNHKDENKKNPAVWNLERCSYSYNNTYGTLLERRKKKPSVSIPSNADDISKKVQDSYLAENALLTNRHRFKKFVIWIDDDGNEIERYNSVSIAAQKHGFERHLFTRTKTVNGIKIIKDKLFIVEEKENEYIPKGTKKARPDISIRASKPVCQYTREGEFIREHESIKEAARAIGTKDTGSISNCCNGKLKTAYGYIWRHKGDKAPESFKHANKRKIEQYSFNGELLNTFDSISDASKFFGAGTPTCIGNNLSGRSHSAFGYIWKYAKEDKK